jgi:sulfotransferase
LARRNDGMRGLFANYYNDTQNEKLIFDTTRVWSAKLPALSELFPKTRVVCCVRDAPWIIDPIERLVRGNVFELSSVFGLEPGNMVYTRINRLATRAGMLSGPATTAAGLTFSSRTVAARWISGR